MNKVGNNKGMTLIEVIVSIAILGIIIVPVATVFIQSLNTAGASDKKLAAQGIAQRYLEGLKNNVDISSLEQSFETNLSDSISPWKEGTENTGYRKVALSGSGVFYVKWLLEEHIVNALSGSTETIPMDKITVSVFSNDKDDGTGLLAELVGLRE